MMNVRRIEYIDDLKSLSLLFMIMIHISIRFLSSEQIASGNWIAANVWDGTARVCVPIFVMISGALLLNSDKPYTIRKACKKVFRLALAYIFWSIIYAVVDNIMKYHTLNMAIAYHILGETIVGYYHMWFIWMIAWLYLLTPIFHLISRNEVLLKYYIILSLIFTFALNYLLAIPLPILTETLRAILSNMNITFVTGYSGYFMLGYYLYRREISVKYRYVIYLLGIISLFYTIIKTYQLSNESGKLVETYYSYLMPNVLFASIALFCLFRYIKARERKKYSLLTLCAKVSLGVYLSHNLFIIGISQTHLFETQIPVFIFIPMITVIIFLFSFVLSIVISKLPRIGSWIV